MTLSTRIEAGQPSRELFEEAWLILSRNEPNPDIGWDDRPSTHKARAFHKMLDAEAWTSAAEMLVPEGCSIDLRTYQTARTAQALIHTPNRTISASGQTPATALLAAVVRSTEEKNP